MFVGPLTVLPDRVPMCGAMIGDMIGATLCCMTGAVATSTTLTVAAIVWVFARPMIGTLPHNRQLML
jgi:hypothetical protein